MDELLQLLLNEFDIDVPNIQAALDSARADPTIAPQIMPDVLDFLQRSAQASEVAGLLGFSEWLAGVSQCAQVSIDPVDPSLVRWLSGWIAPARAYLERPAQSDTVKGLCAFLAACPNEAVGAAAEAFEEMLSVAPTLAGEQVDVEAEEPSEADVSLATDDCDPGLLSALLADAPEQLERLRGEINRVGAGSATPESLIEAQRIAHTLKGSGNIVGVVGIGRTAHFLEDVLEWVLGCVRDNRSTHPLVTRDMALAVDTMQQMVAYLHGEEATPAHALAMLRRLAQWSHAIRTKTTDDFAPPAIDLDTSGENGDSLGVDAADANQANTTSVGSSVRVGVEQLTRVLRRAGQSLFASQRMSQLLVEMRDDLSAALDKQRELDARLRELQGYVDRQVVNIRAQRDAGEEFDALELDRYDAMFSLSRFITEDVHDQHAFSTQAFKSLTRAQDVLREEQAQLTIQHRELIDARMVPVKSLVPRLRRNVQQTAATTGKLVELVVTGEHTPVDSNVLNRLTEPLLHLVRNAIDHGIEPPERRELLGKSPTGQVTIEVRAVGQEIELKCTDNGAGLDAYAIHQKAIEYGLVSDNEPLTPEQIYRLILLPGFSTKAEVTEISGRGVGLDVVNDRVVAMKGRIGIASVPGEGTTFTLTLPQSLGAAHIVVAEAGGQRFGLPVESVERALASDQFTVQHSSVQIEGETWPLIDMSAVLGLGSRRESSRTSLVLCRAEDRRVGLLVEKVVDSREVILQDAGTLLRRIPGVAAATLREDGRALLILDVAGLAGAQPHRTPTSRMRSRAQTERTRVLVVDDALSARRAMAQLFEDAGFDAIACKDGQEAIERLRERTPSAVVTDLEMPMVNGIELTQRIRENPSWSALPVVMITSRGSDKHRERAHAAGVDVFLTKPFSDVELLAHIRTLLSKSSATSSSIEQ